MSVTFYRPGFVRARPCQLGGFKTERVFVFVCVSGGVVWWWGIWEIALSGSQAVKSQYNCLVTDRLGLYRQYQGHHRRGEQRRGRLLQDQDQIKLCPTWNTTFPPDITFSPHLCVSETFNLPSTLILNITNISLSKLFLLAGGVKWNWSGDLTWPLWCGETIYNINIVRLGVMWPDHYHTTVRDQIYQGNVTTSNKPTVQRGPMV